MKIFSWIQSKRNGKEISSKMTPNPQSTSNHMIYQSCKEEFADWPNGLLAIGTFGNSHLKDSENSKFQDAINFPYIQDQHVKSAPEYREADEKELRLLLNQCGSNFSGESEDTLLVQKFIQDLLDNEKKNGDESMSDFDLSEEKETVCLEKNERVSRRGKSDIQMDKRRNEISKKSLKFLLKKAFVCRGGFVPSNPVLRDPIPDPRLDKSRFEKILRAMLHKKIYPHKTGSPKAGSYKKCLDMPDSDNGEEERKDADRRNKWVKTDSEYIVLEI